MICNACRGKLLRLHQDPDGVNNLSKVRYDRLLGPPPVTRQNVEQPCVCSVCQLSRTCLHWEVKHLLSQYIDSPAPPPSLTPDVIKICAHCHSQIGQGLSHDCSRSTFRENVADLVKDKSERTRGRVVSTLLKDVFEDQCVDTRGGTVQLQTGGKSLKVTLGAKAAELIEDRKYFSHKDLVHIKSNRNLSDREILGLAGDVRKRFGRGAIEPGLQGALKVKNHALDYIFDVKTKDMKGKKDKETGEHPVVSCTGVSCKDATAVEELIQLVMKERGCNPFNTKGLIGLDDGQGMLKVGFTLIEVRNFCDTLLICFVNIDTTIAK